MNSIDARAYTRIALEIGLEVERIPDGKKQKGRTQNISTNGLFIHCESPFSAGTECILKLFVEGSACDVLVHAKIEVVYSNAFGMGAQLICHLNLCSYDHLKKLVLYNADTETGKAIENEINADLNRIWEG
ncbi:MAG: PilZ domain-containing protein [Nitrospiria bacterium]